ncbi:MAG: hypothetical protein QOI10_2638 [Solirubrobacterales bacterium]|nr:hypothetical protein [Solirubrobacterales bacterium]
MTRTSRLQPLARAVLRTQTDDRLVALVRGGREAAFEEIVRRYRPALVAFAAAYGPPDPEDVVQESLARSWEALRQTTGEMHVKAWLYTIVRNRALNARRDVRPTEQLSDEIDGVRQPPEILLAKDELDRAVAAVVALPEAQREALVRSSLEGHTHEQIAAAIGSSPGAVRQLIYRARLNVRHAVGAVIPLPLVALLADAGAGGAGAAAGSATAAGVGVGAAGGVSLATKAALIAAVGVVAAGSGVAIKHAHDSSPTDRAKPAAASRSSDTSEAGDPATASALATADEPGGQATVASGDGVPGHDSGPGPSANSQGGGPGAQSGPQTTTGDDNGGGAGPGDDSSGSGSSGSGSEDSGSDDGGQSGSDDGGHSGPGAGGTSGSGDGGSSGSGHEGSGSGGSSGSGDGGSSGSGESDSSGSGGGGSSGPGGGDDDPVLVEPVVTTPTESSGPGSGDGSLELPDGD